MLHGWQAYYRNPSLYNWGLALFQGRVFELLSLLLHSMTYRYLQLMLVMHISMHCAMKRSGPGLARNLAAMRVRS